MKAFHAYDIRGIYNEDFNKEDAYKIGFYLPTLLKTNKILVGRDVRLSSPEIYDNLTRGINDAWADVYDAGLSTTPMIYWLTAKFDFQASVMITASHNGKEYNGMKISRAGAKPVGYDTGLSELEKMLDKEVMACSQRGKIIPFDKKQEYIDFQKQYLPNNIGNMNLSIDCSNGMSALLIKDIIGENHNYIFDTLDGSFPNHEANPLIAENVVDLQKAVIENKSDLGIIFDGDADRVMFVDEKGKFISPDLMIAVLGNYFLKNSKEKTLVLQDIRSSKAVGEYLSKFGNTDVHTWKVGRAFASLKMAEIDATFGGELAGHYYFKDFYFSDSGILAMLIIIKVIADMKEKGISVSELINEIKAYANSGEINFRIEDKVGAMNSVKTYFEENEAVSKFMDFDGYRLEFQDWWFNIRPSNTEPYLRLIVEAKSEELLLNKLEIINKLLKEYF
ncbi:MAG: phosphomannomutase/phosphoglucomutase [Bacteroidetes bacterium]|nr:MAG: phosphomannomutase/phosphoglucomutase [Bacteroidota bacterium]